MLHFVEIDTVYRAGPWEDIIKDTIYSTHVYNRVQVNNII